MELKTVCVSLLVVLCIFQAHGADKYTDENRPYEFGFTIDGQQHRHEKKDKNGIIMGEFGFITADGVYHVTVYATDENGHFKILSMKNIRVKPYPTAPEHEGRKGHSLSLPPSQQLSTPHSSSRTQEVKQKSNSVAVSCSHCKLPTTTTPAPKVANIAVISTNNNYKTQSQISGNLQSTSQNYHSKQVYSQYEQSQTPQLPSQPSLASKSYQQGSIASQQQQYNPSLSQSYKSQTSQAFNINNQEQFTNKVTSNHQNSPQVSGQDEFNVGRQYLQKAHRQQNYQEQVNGQPNSLQQSGVDQNYHPGLNAAQQQEIIVNQYNLQVPYTKENNPQSLKSPQSYSDQSVAKMHNYDTSEISHVNGQPNSLQQSGVGQNYHPGLNAAQQQEITTNQYGLQVPYTSENNQQSLKSSQSYSHQSGAKMQNYDTSEIRQNFPRTNTEQNYVHQTNNFVQQKSYQNQLKNPSETIKTSTGDRQQKTFKDILQTLNSEQQYKSPDSTANLYQPSQQLIAKPVLVAAQMQIVDKNTNIYHKNPGESEGLPKGLTKGDMTQLLYTFNYTVGFHGHHEEGYTNGAKIGYYYVTGRNGVRTRVDYVADETGFHPRISQEALDIQSDDVPKPETEKEDKYGLKGYEFKWLYYPVGSK